MNDMTKIIVPKSDQLNTDDLIAGPRTIAISKVDIRPGQEQPCSIFFEGDGGKPWKPCKSMARVLVAAWGPDAREYIGRQVTLYRDPAVKWGGMEVGGIRVSHLSHIERDMVLALTATKGKRAPHQVKVLREAATSNQPSDTGSPPAGAAAQPAADAGSPSTDAGQSGAASSEPSPLELQDAIAAAATLDELAVVWTEPQWKAARKVWNEATVAAVTKLKDDRKAELSKPVGEDEIPF